VSDLFLLREWRELCDGGVCRDLLTEEQKRDVKENNALYLTGILQEADIKNQNERIYPYDVLLEESENYEKLVRESRAVGTLDHEDSPEISLDKVSHLVTRIWWDDKKLMGTMKVLSTPRGQTLRSLINDGVKIGTSSRSLGVVKEGYKNGVYGKIVQSPLSIICFDIVQEPSVVGAFMNPGVLKESRELLTQRIFSKQDRLFRLMNDILN
jgi:hypothetical protein